jgi:hypothetical protein
LGEQHDDITVKALYLGNLCARGDEEKIQDFINETDPQELQEILNCSPDQQWNGTCLHVLLNWITGDKAISLFGLLVRHGATFRRDGYNSFPWQRLGSVWITPVQYTQIGERNQEEFEETSANIRRIYNFEDNNDEDDSDQDDNNRGELIV